MIKSLKLYLNIVNQISNSSIRYAQLIEIDPTIEVFCNRGTSGNGSTSTAIGAAVANDKLTVLLPEILFCMTVTLCGIIIFLKNLKLS
jgi:2-succinyl-5-enolpyruvyl-6-hydroxy-3-cyclohexene-1-carboxylate synthase